MLDPFTILGAISTAAAITSAACNAIQKLHRFMEEVGDVDEVVKELEMEVSLLASTCLAIGNLLRNMQYSSGADQVIGSGQHLATLLQAQLMQCEKNVGRFAAAISDLREPSDNFVERAWKKFKLDRSKDDLVVVKDKIHSHNQGMQIVLIMVNIQVSIAAPVQAAKGLEKKLDVLKKSIDQMRSAKSLDRDATRGLGEDVESDTALLEYAREVMSQGETFYDRSIVNGLDDERSRINLPDDEVLDWLRHLRILNNPPSIAVHAPEETIPHLGVNFAVRSRPGIVSTAATTPISKDAIPAIKGKDADEEINLGVARQTVHLARNAFTAQDWERAEVALLDALDWIRYVPTSYHTAFDVGELECMLAVCAYYTQASEDARAALLPITQRNGRSDAERKMIFTADILLALLYLRSGEVETAWLLGDCAMQGRSRLLGGQHDDTLEAVGLMAAIATKQGWLARAQTYYGLIPPEKRSMYKLRFIDLLEEERASARHLHAQTERARSASPRFMTRTTISTTVLNTLATSQPSSQGQIPAYESLHDDAPKRPPQPSTLRLEKSAKSLSRLYVSRIMIQGLPSSRLVALSFKRLVTLVTLRVDGQEKRRNSGSLLNSRRPVWLDPFEVDVTRDSTLVFTVYDFEKLVTPLEWRGTVTIRVGEVLDLDVDNSVTICRYLWTGPYRSSAMITVVLSLDEE